MGYRGLRIPIPAGRGGFNGSLNQANIPETELTEALNLSFDGNAWAKLPGATLYDSNAIAGTPKLLKGFDWNPSTSVQRMITAWDNGSIYKETSGNVDAVTLVSGLTFTHEVSFVEAGQEAAGENKKLFMFSDGVEPKYLDGDGVTLSSFTNLDSDWSGSNYPAFGIPFDGRVLALAPGGREHQVYGSTLTDHSDFTGSGSFVADVWPGEGQRIAAAIPFLSESQTTRLYIFKYPLGLYYLDLSDPVNPYTFKVREDIGMAGSKAWARAGNDIYFLSSVGTIHSLRAVLSSEDIEDSDISSALELREWLKDNALLSQLRYATVVYDEQRKELKMAFTAKDDSDGAVPPNYCNGTAIHADVSGNPIKLSVEKRTRILNELFFRRDSDGDISLYGGGEGGVVYQFNQTARSLNGSAYTASFKTVDTDLSYADPGLKGIEKRFDYFEITVTPTGNYSLSVEVYIDGEVSETLSINLGQTGGVFGTGLFGTATFGGKLLTKHKEQLHGHGDYIGFRGISSGNNEDFSISEMAVYCKPQMHKGTR